MKGTGLRTQQFVLSHMRLSLNNQKNPHQLHKNGHKANQLTDRTCAVSKVYSPHPLRDRCCRYKDTHPHLIPTAWGAGRYYNTSNGKDSNMFILQKTYILIQLRHYYAGMYRFIKGGPMKITVTH